MTYHQAQKRVRNRRLLGAGIALLACVVFIISLLKGLYFHFEGVQILTGLDEIAKKTVYWIYSETQFLALFWRLVPAPSMHAPSSFSTVVLLGSYAFIFLGAAIFKSGSALAQRLKKIQEEIEDEIMRQSVSGNVSRSRIEIEQSIEVRPPSVLSQFHALYIAPVVVGIILAIFGYVVGI